MTNPVSMLVISREAVLVGELDASRQPRDGLSVQAELGSLSQLNGQAIRMATGKDLIVVQTDGRDPEELAAIRTLTGAVTRTATRTRTRTAAPPLAATRTRTRTPTQSLTPTRTPPPTRTNFPTRTFTAGPTDPNSAGTPPVAKRRKR